MEKIKIKVNRTKDGYDVDALFENGKSMKIPPDFGIPHDANGKDAFLEREKGQIVRVRIEEKEYMKRSQPQYNQKEKVQNPKSAKTKNIEEQSQQTQSEARAPYNFVPLNDIVVQAPELPDFDKYYLDRYTGFIEIELATVTPLYIRRESESSEFFSIDGKPKIPGSSLRGMVRTLVEIVSYGKFKSFEDKRLYFRGLADKSKSFKEYYQERIKNVKAGFLNYDEVNDEYFIIPGEFESFSDVSREFCYEFAENKDESENKDEYTCQVWGKMKDKHNNWKVKCRNDNEDKNIKLTKYDIRDYENDENRRLPSKNAKVLDLLSLARNKTKFPKGVPIFYSTYKDINCKDRIAFGHTRYFRFPYGHSIEDKILPKDLIEAAFMDFTEAIFGIENAYATRVFFEDLELLEDSQDAFLEKTSPKILSSPKPTTFQHYLEQPKGNQGKLNHWDSDGTKIRGYKLYWHRNTSDNPKDLNSWSEEEIKGDTQHTTITPIKPGIKFKGRIRFENLSSEELGVLLFVLMLPENHYHKLGMGKSLGLGSVKITPELFITDRSERYKSLFDNDNWALGLRVSHQKLDQFVNAFEKYILEKLNLHQTLNLWDVDRLKELKVMLNWEKTQMPDWLEKTRYMNITSNITSKNEFKNRPVLPKPTELV